MLNNIYNRGHLPKDLCTSVSIALPRKIGETQCGQHRTISLMSQITKLLLRIIILRIRSKIKREIAEEQRSFVEGKGTTNTTYIRRTLAERAIQVQEALYLCSIDCTKAFDTIKHENIVNKLKTLNIDGRDLRVIKSLYWGQTTAIRYDNELGDFVRVKRGVRPGCVLSPDLFSLYSECIVGRFVIFQALLSEATPSTTSYMLMTLPLLQH